MANKLIRQFPDDTVGWPSKGLRRASVSSFGFGGSNSHVVLDDAYHFLHLRGLIGNHCTVQEPPHQQKLEISLRQPLMLALPPVTPVQTITADQEVREMKLLVWSAADEGGLARLAKAYRAHFQQLLSSLRSDEANKYLESLAYTLAARRSALSWRAYATARSITELQDLPTKISKPVRSRAQPKLGYIFTGQGAQHAGMAKQLTVYPIFKASLLRSEMYLNELGCTWSLLGLFQNSNSSPVGKS
jgi:acyl transferase domain-containing protein